MPQELSILLVEDNPGDACLVRTGLQGVEAFRCHLTHVDRLANALDVLSQRTHDVGLLDLGLPDARGLEVVQRVREAAPDMPLLVLTALKDDALAIQSLQQGAQDYLVKAEVTPDSLRRSLRYAMERHELQARLVNLSLVDDLTGLYNRKGFVTLANQHAKVAHRTGRMFLIAFIDLDDLKHINDTLGHQEGNHALVDAAHVLRNSFRQADILARYGGDEFAALIADQRDESNAVIVTNRIREHVRTLNAQRGRGYQLSLSIGISASDASRVSDIEQLLHQADLRMYQEKQNNRRVLSGFEPRNDKCDSRKQPFPDGPSNLARVTAG